MLDRPNPQSARQQRYRLRLRHGEACASVTYDHRVVDFLIRTEWLTEAEADDRQAVGLAIGRLLRASAKDNP